MIFILFPLKTSSIRWQMDFLKCSASNLSCKFMLWVKWKQVTPYVRLCTLIPSIFSCPFDLLQQDQGCKCFLRAYPIHKESKYHNKNEDIELSFINALCAIWNSISNIFFYCAEQMMGPPQPPQMPRPMMMPQQHSEYIFSRFNCRYTPDARRLLLFNLCPIIFPSEFFLSLLILNIM